MNNNNSKLGLFERFAPLIQAGLPAGGNSLDSCLKLHANGDIEVYYAPFDYIETQARVVLVGITPGLVQAQNALDEAHRQLAAGATRSQALRHAKIVASFSGSMRPNLVKLLDAIKLNHWLNISSAQTLFEEHSRLVHYTSVLRYPVFFRAKNYSGSPAPERSSFLRDLINRWFVDEVRQLVDAVFVPLGPVPARVLLDLTTKGLLDRGRVLSGLPHPSGSNAERIAYFLGRKAAADCSVKCNPARLDAAKHGLLEQIVSLQSV